MILETILTTMDEAGRINCAPMGVEWGEEVIVVKPFRNTRTFRNLCATKAAVVNLTDNILLFAQAAIGNPVVAARPATAITGAVLEDACSWREVRVEEVDSSQPRARVVTRVVHRGSGRDFLGFNRACHAVLEASILATRTHFLPREEILSEFQRLQVIVDKTAGPREQAAMELLARHVRTAPGTASAVRVEAPARLHLGMLDLGGSLGRRFGGLGVAVARPAVVLEATANRELSAEGEDAESALAFARRYLAAAGVAGGGQIRIEAVIPRHAGLGSGTKLALAVATALATLHGRPAQPNLLARAVGRGRRSAVGLWTFALGGLVVEGGRRPHRDDVAPLLLRQPLPKHWRCVLVIPDGVSGLSGPAEAAAFGRLASAEEQSARIAHLVLMSLLPALVEGDLKEFGAALTHLQRLVGECFQPVQGGHFSSPRSASLVEALLAWGAAGAGQSSWGPTVFGLAADERQGRELVGRAEAFLGGKGRVELVPFDNQGARVRRV